MRDNVLHNSSRRMMVLAQWLAFSIRSGSCKPIQEKGTKMKVYIAAPLFNEGERAFNEKIEAIIRECGHETFATG